MKRIIAAAWRFFYIKIWLRLKLYPVVVILGNALFLAACWVSVYWSRFGRRLERKSATSADNENGKSLICSECRGRRRRSR